MTQPKVIERQITRHFVVAALTHATLDNPTATSEHCSQFQNAAAQMGDANYLTICTTLGYILHILAGSLTITPGTSKLGPANRALLFEDAPPTTTAAAAVLALLQKAPAPGDLGHALRQRFYENGRTDAPFEAAVALMRMNLERHGSAPLPRWMRWNIIAQITSTALHHASSAPPA